MKGDFSRSTFDPRKHYSSVRMQQGRVQLDADWNEQADILLHQLRTQMADLLGTGAAATQGFVITVKQAETPFPADNLDEPGAYPTALPDFEIGAGRCYVNGILCENETPVTFSKQPDYPAAAYQIQQPADCDQYLVYLDVWQRDITALEDPAIREVALGGADTSTRLKTVWQVKLLPLSGAPGGDQNGGDHGELSSLAPWVSFVNAGRQPLMLKARRDPSSTGRLENRLYRVEIHTGGDQATFKWSRENGSVLLPITEIKPVPAPIQKDDGGCLQVTVQDLDRDPYQFQAGSWVELIDNVTVLNNSPLPLCKIVDLDRSTGSVTLQAKKDSVDRIWAEIGERKEQAWLLRRWEDGEKIVHLQKTTGDQPDEWIDLENGIQVAFSDLGACRPGDYWLIPTRTDLTDGMDWPQKEDPFQPPHGLPHSFAPLALLLFESGCWSVTPPSTFQTLPKITAQLTAADGGLQDVAARLSEVQKTVDALEQLMTHGLSDVSQLHESVETLESKTDGFSAALQLLQEKMSALEAKISVYIHRFQGGVLLIPLVFVIFLLFAYLMDQNQAVKNAAAIQVAINKTATAIQAANAAAIQTAIHTAIQTATPTSTPIEVKVAGNKGPLVLPITPCPPNNVVTGFYIKAVPTKILSSVKELEVFGMVLAGVEEREEYHVNDITLLCTDLKTVDGSSTTSLTNTTPIPTITPAAFETPMVCPDGKVVEGISGSSGDLIDQLIVHCAKLDRSKTERLLSVGGNGGTPFAEQKCPENYVMTGIRGYRDNSNIYQLIMICTEYGMTTATPTPIPSATRTP
jgi:hypothetical protein